MDEIKLLGYKDSHKLVSVVGKYYNLDMGELELIAEDTDEPRVVVIISKNMNGFMHVEVSLDGLEAKISLYPAIGMGKHLSVDGVMDELIYDHEIKAKFIDKNSVIDAVSNCNKNYIVENVIVAVGLSPIHGIDGKIHLHYDLPTRRPGLDSTGRVNFKDIDNIVNVREGDPLVTIIPETEGQPGEGVNGEVLQQMKGKPIKLREGGGVIYNELDKTFYAEFDGHVLLFENRVKVDQLYLVDGDIDLKTGNIDFVGTVKVEGDVPSGFEIKAKNIFVRGIVMDAHLIAEEDVHIETGIKASLRGKITAGGWVKLGYCEGAVIDAIGDITVEKFCYNSNFYSESFIVSDGAEGVISGGEYIAFKGVKANNIGMRNSRSFRIRVGSKRGLEEKMQHLLNERDSLEKTIDDADRKIRDVVGRDPKAKKDPAMKKAIGARKQLLIRKESLNQKITKVLEESMYDKPLISAAGRIMDGVILGFYASELEIKESISSVKYYFDRNKQKIDVCDYKVKIKVYDNGEVEEIDQEVVIDEQPDNA